MRIVVVQGCAIWRHGLSYTCMSDELSPMIAHPSTERQTAHRTGAVRGSAPRCIPLEDGVVIKA